MNTKTKVFAVFFISELSRNDCWRKQGIHCIYFRSPVPCTFTTAPLGFYSYLFTQCSRGYDSLHSGILHATNATLCRSGPIITQLTCLSQVCFLPMPKESHPFPGRRQSDSVLGQWSVHQVPVSALPSLLSISEHTFITVYPHNDFP